MLKHAIAATLSLWLPILVFAGDLDYQAAGGSSLIVTVKDASQQVWRVEDDGRIIVAALVKGQLVLEDFQWRVSPGPEPKPEPEPEPQPEPEPEPPVPDASKTVIWIEESASRTPSQAAAIIDKQIRQAIEKAGWRLRVVDQDIVDENGKPPAELAPYLESARQAGLPRIFILADGKEVFVGAGPKDSAEFLLLLRKFGLRVNPDHAQPDSFSPALPAEAKHAEEAAKPAAANKAASACENGRCYTPAPTVRRWRVFR
jgi:colicin import membrane protein